MINKVKKLLDKSKRYFMNGKFKKGETVYLKVDKGALKAGSKGIILHKYENCYDIEFKYKDGWLLDFVDEWDLTRVPPITFPYD